MAKNVAARRRRAASSSQYVSRGEGFWTTVSMVAAGPGFVDITPGSRISGKVRDTVRIREYFHNAREKLKLDEPAG